MEAFIKKIFLYLLPLALLSIPIDYFLSSQLKKSKYYAQDEYSVWNDLYDGSINADVAIYGSSRAWVHINPTQIEQKTGLSAYNLGIDGHNFTLQYLRHRLLLKYNKQPRYIIYSLDMFTLQNKTDLYNPDQFLPYMLFNKQLRNFTKTYEGYTALDFYIPLVRYYSKTEAIKSAFKNAIFPVDTTVGRQKGYQGKIEEWNSDFENAKTTMEYYQVIPDTILIHKFESFLNECRDKNIQIIFVYTPEYTEGQQFVRNRNQIMNLFKNIAEKYNIPMLDYSDDDMCNQKNYFYNASHLTKDGAEIFTGKMIGDLKKNKLVDAVSSE